MLHFAFNYDSVLLLTLFKCKINALTNITNNEQVHTVNNQNSTQTQTKLTLFITNLIKQASLPDEFAQFVQAAYLPIAEKLHHALNGHQTTPIVLGIQGTQGSGKSTCAAFLQAIMQQQYGITTLVLSIDDLYLSKQTRADLAQSVHPLLATRGVPGTHDLTLADEVFTALLSGQPTSIPRFNKAQDDRCPENEWENITKPVDLIILEGWCVGLPPLDTSQLDAAINTLEAEEDADAVWRHFIADQLNADYQQLFSYLDYLLVIQAPSFECVQAWRLLQEEKLRSKLIAQGANITNSQLMDEAGVKCFIAHYERLTRHALQHLPSLADWIIYLDDAHGLAKVDLVNPCMSNMLVSTDLDGTLLDHHSYSWREAKPAMRALRARQIPLILNSSKNAAEMMHLQANMGIRQPLIVENGSALYIPIEMLSPEMTSSNMLETDTLDGFEKIEDYFVKVFGSKRSDILQCAHALRDQAGYQFTGFADYTIEDIASSTGLSMQAASLAAKKCYSEPFVWHDTADALAQFTQDLQAHGIQILKGGRFYHLQGMTDKAKPLQWLKTHSDIFPNCQTPLRLVCLGDNHNDVAMLNAANIAVCVKSPVNEFPPVDNQQVIYTQQFGSKGWNTAILSILTASTLNNAP